jgi:hypothetical protein
LVFLTALPDLVVASWAGLKNFGRFYLEDVSAVANVNGFVGLTTDFFCQTSVVGLLLLVGDAKKAVHPVTNTHHHSQRHHNATEPLQYFASRNARTVATRLEVYLGVSERIAQGGRRRGFSWLIGLRYRLVGILLRIVRLLWLQWVHGALFCFLFRCIEFLQ